MQRESIYHSPSHRWSYAYDPGTFHLRLKTKRSDVERVVAIAGDKYDWDHHYQEVEMELIAADGMHDYWEAVIRPEFKRFSYGFRLHSGEETAWLTEDGFSEEQPTPAGGYFEAHYIHPIDLFEAPEWAKEAIFYQIYPERFENGDTTNDPEGTSPWGEQPEGESFFGGDLQGIINRIGHLNELGVNAVYLTPVFRSPSNHKYDTTDYREVDPHFGDKDLLKMLVEVCHKHGIRVVLDAVFNHASEQFPPFQDVLEKGDQSEFKDWFHLNGFPVEVQDGIANYDTFGFYGNMPKLNTANPDVKNYLIETAVNWMKETGIDGWRLDVANEIDHHFWRDFRAAIKDANKEAFIIGEVWSDSLRWLLGDQFDSVMNYPFTELVLSFFADRAIPPARFAEKMNRLLMRYPQQTNETLFNLLSSHDIPRVMTRCGGDTKRLKQAVVYMMTSMGLPCVYYGDEFGMEGGEDPDCRRCMVWNEEDQNRELFDFYKLLISLRKERAALRSGRFRVLLAEEDNGSLIYERLDGKEHFTIWMNRSDEPAELSHPMNEGGWSDALTGERIDNPDGKLVIGLEPNGYRIVWRKIE
ncbi:alpha-glycosidase [Paenibacillus sp. JDR-2]|uniref:alpha-glycosidase n=1 Tax=Paenibacillus sp. (strain JDR-2) TaxID=324057 RepID=UPI0001664CA2|nr:alpha-glycosidase [Paenibacillus sp. JDR-2]ACS99724.1 alpha amylase catalytic region [Paenibacillus sp. JDR-2]